MPISRNRRPSAPAARLPPVPAGGDAGRVRPQARRLTPRSRVIRRILIALLLAFTLLALERTGLMERWLGGLQGERLDWRNDYQLVEYLRALVVQRGLTGDRKDCLLFIIDGNDPPTGTRMQVMEKHSGACPGERGQLPKLFTLKIDRLARQVQSDAGSPGLFHPLP